MLAELLGESPPQYEKPNFATRIEPKNDKMPIGHTNISDTKGEEHNLGMQDSLNVFF